MIVGFDTEHIGTQDSLLARRRSVSLINVYFYIISHITNLTHDLNDGVPGTRYGTFNQQEVPIRKHL